MKSHPFQGQFEFCLGDIRENNKLESFCKDLDCVIHLAAAHHDFGISEQEYFDVNESGTEKLLQMMTNYGVKTIIFYSSVAIYGTKKIPADENSDPDPENPYGASKLAAEKKIIDWTKEK